MSGPKILWNHDPTVPPAGTASWDGDKLRIKLNTPISREVMFNLFGGGAGIRILGSYTDAAGENETIDDFEIFEWSIPAGNEER